MSSPTARSLDYLRKRGWVCCVVEQHIRPPGRETFGFKRDAFGFGDILACKAWPRNLSLENLNRIYDVAGGFEEMEAIALIQVTSGSNLAARIAKIHAEPKAKTWLEAGGRIFVHGWRKLGKAGKRKLWRVDEREITLADFPPQESELAGVETVPS